MNREELLMHHAGRYVQRALEIMQVKNHDYAGKGESNRSQTLNAVNPWESVQPSRGSLSV